MDIEIDCCDELDSVVKLPTLKLSKYLKTVAMHADDLDTASYRLNEIRKAIEEENIHEIYKSKETHHSGMMYIICGLVTTGILYYVYKRFCPKWLLPLFGRCCSKRLEEKFEESFKQVQTLSSKPIVVKQYQYGASVHDLTA